MRSTYSLSFLEGTNVLSRKREPFALFSLTREPTMPISLNARRIICLDDVNWLELFGKLDADLAFPSQRIIGATDFVLPTGAMFQKVNEPNLDVRKRFLIRRLLL